MSFVQGKKLLVFGSPAGRAVVKDLLGKMDLENASNRVTRVFTLKNADADQVAKNIDSLFSNRLLEYESSYGSRSWTRDPSSRSRVKVTADVRRNTVTVITDADTMGRIAKLIEEEWDSAISAEEVEPKVYQLKHADPVEVKDLLEGMFCKKQQRNMSFYDIFYGPSSSSTEFPPVGRLFGQFSFQALANTNQLIVTTKNKANYEVIDRLVEQLDQPQEAGLPRVVELKHANAEDLAEQLNAMLAEPGTPAQIPRSQRTLATGVPPAQTTGSDKTGATGGTTPSQAQSPQGSTAGTMAF